MYISLPHQIRARACYAYRPAVAVNVQNTLLARVISMAGGVSEYHLSREHETRKPKSQLEIKKASDTSAPESHSMDVEHTDPTGSIPTQTPLERETKDSEQTSSVERPQIMDHFTFGINEVTRLLEDTSKSSRRRAVADETDAVEQLNRQFSGLILVCRGDVNPPIIISHLPYLVAACNSTRSHSGAASQPADKIWLVPDRKSVV